MPGARTILCRKYCNSVATSKLLLRISALSQAVKPAQSNESDLGDWDLGIRRSEAMKFGPGSARQNRQEPSAHRLTTGAKTVWRVQAGETGALPPETPPSARSVGFRAI